MDAYKSTNLIEEALTPSGLAYDLLLFRNNVHALFREDAMDFIARWIQDAGRGSVAYGRAGAEIVRRCLSSAPHRMPEL